MNDSTPRWRYRFSNYKRAFSLLREAIEPMSETGLSQLEKEGTIRRFKCTMELAWNVMKDYLENEGVIFKQITPRCVIRKAFEADLTEHGRVWMEALDARNKMSHTYDFQKFEEVIEKIQQPISPCYGRPLSGSFREGGGQWLTTDSWMKSWKRFGPFWPILPMKLPRSTCSDHVQRETTEGTPM